MLKKEDKPESKRHLNRDRRWAQKAADIALFLGKYGRKAQRDCEPNDRRHDRKVEERIKRMNPLELDRLMREDED